MEKTPETNKVLESMELETPDSEFIDLSPEEVEINVAPLRLSEEQFSFVALGLRNRMTSAVGESMQYVEMTGLSEVAQKALKDAIKRSIWSGVRDHLRGVADASELDREMTHDLIYGKKVGDVTFVAGE